MAQKIVTINLAPIDGIAITPDNIFNFQVMASGSGTVQVQGTVHYRSSNLSMSYTFSYPLKQGMNVLSEETVHPKWQFSSPALQELFLTYKILPEGTYEYCVSLTSTTVAKEPAAGEVEECLYHRADDIFMINLIDPENNAKLQEYNPMLSWVANYAFASELTYRLRVAEIKQGQNPSNAVMRNQPVFDENNLMQNSIVYPIYAKPLVANQPYAWTVDAYYKGILLGGSEVWQFIIPDSTTPDVTSSRAYVDIKREKGANKQLALGTLKLKYVLDDMKTDNLQLELFSSNNKKCMINPSTLTASYGDNRYEINLKEYSNLKHKAYYTLKITTKTGHLYILPFQYLNPEY